MDLSIIVSTYDRLNDTPHLTRVLILILGAYDCVIWQREIKIAYGGNVANPLTLE